MWSGEREVGPPEFPQSNIGQVAASASETKNARGVDVRPRAISADRAEAGTGIAPEPPDLIGSPQGQWCHYHGLRNGI
jgi:hypothetical protein